jgi:hypothetical protein
MTETNKGNLPEMAKAKLEEFRRRLMPAGQGGVEPPASNNEPGQVVVETDSVEPSAQDEPERAHDEPAPDDQAALVPVLSAVERINAVLDEIEAAKARQEAANTRRSEAIRREYDARLVADKEIAALDRDILLRAYEVGAMLTEQKRAVGHGKWGKWLKENCPKSQNTAIDYMLVAEWRDRLEALSQQPGVAVISSIRDAKRRIVGLKDIEKRHKKLDEEDKQKKPGEQDNTDDPGAADTGQGDGDIDDDEPEGAPVEIPLDTYERVFRERDADRFLLLVRNFDWEPEYMKKVARHMLRVAKALEETKKMQALRKARSASARGFVRVAPTAH